MGLLKLLASSSYGIYNKDLARKIGLEGAVLIGELASEYDYWLQRDGLESEGYFFSTIDNIAKATTLSEFQQRKIINNLKKLNILEVKLKGLPAKRYIKINEKAIEQLLNTKDEVTTQLRTSSLQSKELDTEKVKPNNNKYNNNKALSKDNEAEPQANNNSLANNISLDEEDNKYLESNTRLLNKHFEFIDRNFISEEIKQNIKDWLSNCYSKKPSITFTPKMLKRELDELTSNCKTKEELLQVVIDTTRSQWNTFKYILDKKKSPSANNRYVQNNTQIRITEQKRSGEFVAL